MASKFARSCINASRWDCTLEPRTKTTALLSASACAGPGPGEQGRREIVAVRADQPFNSVDDLWRRAGVPVASLVQIAEADAMKTFSGLARREAFGRSRDCGTSRWNCLQPSLGARAHTIEEVREPEVALRPMTSGGEVVEDYSYVGLTLRAHPVTFLRADLEQAPHRHLRRRHETRDGKWLTTAGLVLVRQKPGPPRASCSSP